MLGQAPARKESQEVSVITYLRAGKKTNISQIEKTVVVYLSQQEEGDNKMEKVFIVVEPIPYEGDTVLRVFAKYEDALVYGEELVLEGTIEEFDIYEREVY